MKGWVNNVKKNKFEIDMCNGSIMDKLISFSLPLMVSGILQLAFNAVDIIVVGRFSGSQALAAVGSTTALINVFTNLFIGISLGANVLAARFYAAGKDREMSETVHTSITLALISGIMMAVIGVLLAKWALEIMGTPDDVIDLAVLYLRIYLLGMPFIMLYDFGSSILRSTGDSKRPLYSLIVAGIVNTVLNLILVIVFKLGVSGVAIATVISNIVSSSIVIYILMHDTGSIRLDIKKLTIVPKELKKILTIGVPAGLQGMVFSIANVCIQSTINSFGSSAIAGSAAALNYEFFAYFMVSAFAQATVTFTSQNYGAGKYDRCRKIYHIAMAFSLLSCGLLSAIFVLGRDMFLGFYSTDADVLYYAEQRIIIAITLELLTSVYEISAGAMRGLGHSLLPAIITVIGSCVLRLIWISTVCRVFHEFWVLIIIYPISWIITGIIMVIAYHVIKGKVMKEKVIKAA